MSDTLWMASHVYLPLVLFLLFKLRITLLLCTKNLVCNNVIMWTLFVILNLYSGPAFVWALRISTILL
jgi:hypothetical protein